MDKHLLPACFRDMILATSQLAARPADSMSGHRSSTDTRDKICTKNC
jgi:hypothetical protein